MNLSDLAARFGTPLYVYDLDRISAQFEALHASEFDRVRYAQKANGAPPLLVRLLELGAAVDCVSAGELDRARRAGFGPSSMTYTSDVFSREALAWIAEQDVRCNLGTMDMIEQLAEVRPGASVILRINPGFGSGRTAHVTTGGPASKHGIWHEDITEALARCAAAQLTVGGLHLHVGSGANREGLVAAIDAMDTALTQAPESVRVVSAGGGLPVPYRSEEPEFDVAEYASTWNAARLRWQERHGREFELEVEPGRYLVAQAGRLVTEVRGCKSTGEYDYVLVDAGFHTLLRPTLYGAYHRIEPALAKSGPLRPQVVAGPLCESADVLTQGAGMTLDPRELPDLDVGDLLVVHDAGAYGATMASHYNSMPLPAEAACAGGEVVWARGPQSPSD